MYRSPLKVFGEKFIEPAAAAATMAGTTVIRCGGTMGGLEVVVCAEPSATDPEAAFDLKVGTEITISLFHADANETASFKAMPAWKQVVAAPEDDPAATTITVKPGEIIARMTLPYDCKTYVKGNLGFAAGSGGAIPSGRVSMFPAYLPR